MYRRVDGATPPRRHPRSAASRRARDAARRGRATCGRSGKPTSRRSATIAATSSRPRATGTSSSRRSPTTIKSLWQVAWHDDRVVGQVRTYVVAEENERIRSATGLDRGHLHRSRRGAGRGVAAALICASLRQLAERGLRRGSARSRHREPEPGARPVRSRSAIEQVTLSALYELRLDDERAGGRAPPISSSLTSASSHQSLYCGSLPRTALAYTSAIADVIGPGQGSGLIVDRVHRRHLGGRAAHEHLLGDVQVAAGDVVDHRLVAEIARRSSSPSSG